MRLTQIKLAGFKSFVDVTTIRTPGQLVGIVGPNGCGKSNVIDAVRWVLGESKASALRGESMQDVIFNGAGERKPLSRASVELVFDNSLGRAAGQWSRYAELSIKRVLTRDGDSVYYINQTPVRRRDITDLFLGTGLGPRAYAIIEQGMIARLIEAKPEEMRVYLEEAAGVSKYKERRKETESRLADARENLLRVEDVQRELVSQLEKLTHQAEVAQQYQQLQQTLVLKQQLFYWGKQQEAEANRQKASVERARYEREYEEAVATLRVLEARLEEERQKQSDVQENLNGSQAAYYQASAEVSRLEQLIQSQRQRQQRLEQEKQQLLTQQQEIQTQHNHSQTELTTNQAEHGALQKALELAVAAEQANQKSLPEAEQELQRLRAQFAEIQRRGAEIEQAIQLEEAHRAHAKKMQQQWQTKVERLQREQNDLKLPAGFSAVALEGGGESLKRQLEEAKQRFAEAQEGLSLLESRLAQAELVGRESRAELEKITRNHTELKAQHTALSGLQNRLQKPEEAQWLAQQGLAVEKPLWQLFSVEPGWEDAVEAVLRERLKARGVQELAVVLNWASLPAGSVFYAASTPENTPLSELPSTAKQETLALPSLLSKLNLENSPVSTLLAQWLEGIYVADSLAIALSKHHHLPAGCSMVTQDGHWICSTSIHFFAPAENVHGALARQRELDLLTEQLAKQTQALELARVRASDADKHWQMVRQERQTAAQRLAEQQRLSHDLELKFLQFEQASKALLERRSQLEKELQELAVELAQEGQNTAQAEARLLAHQAQREAYFAEREQMRGLRNQAEVHLEKQRQAVRTAERTTQESQFRLRTAENRRQELLQRLDFLQQQIERLQGQLERLGAEESGITLIPLEEERQLALQHREQQENALAEAREAYEAMMANLKAREEERMRREQQLEPMRKKAEDQRLKEQLAEAAVQQFAQQLAEIAAAPHDVAQPQPPEALAALWQTQKITLAQLPGEMDRLKESIQALGPVNLAALEELKLTQGRKGFLDAQTQDLTEAAATLEAAIRRIDRESRTLLQETYDQVNQHFGTLFPQLFGGGQARLVLSGEEILDAGIQVVAQPPGKRNASIHLLSGGEKALTAISLVFAFFQLNPAPFCLLDEVDAPLDDANTERFCRLVQTMSAKTQFLYISHNKIAMEMASQLVGITMAELGVSQVVAVDVEKALQMTEM